MAKRKYLIDENSRVPFVYRAWLFLPIGILLIGLGFLLGWFVPQIPFQQAETIFVAIETILVSIGTTIMLIGVFGTIKFVLLNDVAELKVPQMNNKAKRVSKVIGQQLNNKAVIERLSLAVKTKKNGYALPAIFVYVADDLNSGWVAVENFGQFEKLDRSAVEQSIGGIFNNKTAKYSVVSSSLELGDNFVKFNFEDSTTSHRFHVKNGDLRPFASPDKYSLRLSDDLTWNVLKTPHMSIIASTGGGKTVFAGWYLARLAKLQGWEVYYNSAKPDRIVREFKGLSDPTEIVEFAESMVKRMNERQQKITDSGRDNYSELNMTPILIFFDEVAALNDYLDKKTRERWDKAVGAISKAGRSAGVHMVGISQFATVEAFMANSVRTNMKEAVIMLGGSANSADDRKYMIPGFDVPDRDYGRGQGIAMIISSGKKWATPHYFETPLFE